MTTVVYDRLSIIANVDSTSWSPHKDMLILLNIREKDN